VEETSSNNNDTSNNTTTTTTTTTTGTTGTTTATVNGSVDHMRLAYKPVPQRCGLKLRWSMPVLPVNKRQQQRCGSIIF
jgi:hypothetical protein